MKHILLIATFLINTAHATAEQSGPAGETKEQALSYLGPSLALWLTARQAGLSVQPDKNLSSSALSKSQYDACQQRYERIYADRKVDIHLSLGYMDNSETPYYFSGHNYGRSFVMDAYLHQGFVRALTASCYGNLQACGFTQSPTDPKVFTKQVTGTDGAPTLVTLRTAYSSAGPYNQDNVDTAEQKELSAHARNNFLSGFSQADVNLYVGHARNGGGPDFQPPVLLKNQMPNYGGYYSKKKPGFNDMMNAIESSDRLPEVVGIFSCLSDRWFGKSLRKELKDSAIVLSTGWDKTELAHYDDMANNALGIIDAILRQQCEPGINETIHFSPRASQRYILYNF